MDYLAMILSIFGVMGFYQANRAWREIATLKQQLAQIQNNDQTKQDPSSAINDESSAYL